MLNPPSDQCDQFDDFYDDWLDAAGKRQYEEHLESCTDCQAKLRLQQSLDQHLSFLSRDEVAPKQQALEQTAPEQTELEQTALERGPAELRRPVLTDDRPASTGISPTTWIAIAAIVASVVVLAPRSLRFGEKEGVVDPKLTQSDSPLEVRRERTNGVPDNVIDGVTDSDDALANADDDTTNDDTTNDDRVPVSINTKSDDFIAVVDTEFEEVTFVQLFAIESFEEPADETIDED